MVLGIDKVLELVQNENLVENLSERELNNPEGTGLDLSVGIISKFVKSTSYLGIDQRSTLNTEIIATLEKDGNRQIILSPQEYILVTTNEIINMPNSLVGIIRPRGTLFRSGIALYTGQVNPGYDGNLTFGMHNCSPFDFTFELGSRIAHILFLEINGKSVGYRGQWKGGRISAPIMEKQI